MVWKPVQSSSPEDSRLRRIFDSLSLFLAGQVDPTAVALAKQTTVQVPAAIANTGIVFTRDNGAGKTQLCVRFGTGAIQVLSTEP